MTIGKSPTLTPQRPGSMSASPESVSAARETIAFRSLPEDIAHRVLDTLEPMAQTRLIMADRDSWMRSGRDPALSASARRERYFATHIPTLMNNAESRISMLRNLSLGGVMSGVTEGLYKSVCNDLQQIESLVDLPVEATAEYPAQILAHERMMQRMQLSQMQMHLHAQRMTAMQQNISILLRF